MNILIKKLFHNYSLHFLLLCSFLALQSQSSEEDFTTTRPFTIEKSKYQPQTLEESLYYLEMYEFLSNNKNALLLLESAQKGGMYYNAAQAEFDRYLLNPLSNLKESYNLINNNTSLKAKAEIGMKLSGVNISLEAELDLKGLASDIWSRFSDEDYNNQIANTAQYYTRQTYACIENPRECPLNAQAHQRQAVMNINWHFHGFPTAVDQEGRLLSFEEKAGHSSPAQLEAAEALFNARKLQNISSKIDAISEENEQNAEEVIRSIEGVNEETAQNREEIIATLNTHINTIQEASFKEMEKREQTRRKNFKESDPDYMDEDPIVLAANSNIKKWEKEKENVSKEFETGKISQEEYDREIKNIDNTIAEKKTNIEVYKFKKGMQKGAAWAGAVEAAAKVLGASEEIVQISRIAYAGMKAFDAIGSMVIAGAIDPTGITLALNGASLLFQTISNTPSPDQIMIELLNDIRKRQVKILNKLNEIDHKLEGIDAKINSIIEMLNMSHKQITQKLDYITDELHRIENEIILAIEESKSATNKEFQNSGAFFTDDGRVTLDLLETWDRPHLNEILFQCKHYKDQYDTTGNIRFYDDYNWCMDGAKNQLSMIQESLSDLYQKAKHRFGTDTYVQYSNINQLSMASVISKWGEKVEDRIGLLPSIFKWFNDQYNAYITNIIYGNEKIVELWSNRQKQWKEDRQLINRLEGLSIKHPRFYDEVLTVYAPLTERLPLPENLSFIMQSDIVDYDDKHLTEMCQNLKHIEDLSFYNRQHLERAWWVYLYFSDQMKRGFDSFFEDNLTDLLESYKTYKKQHPALSLFPFQKQQQQDCNCSNVYNQTKEKFIDYMSSQKQTDIFQYIENQQYDIYDFLKLNPEEIAQRASRRSHINNQYLINEGFYKTIQGPCLKFPKPGDNSDSPKKVPYTEAEMDIEEQKEHYNETFQRLQRGKKCWIKDTEGYIKGLTKGSSFQIEKYISFKNIIGKEEKELRHTCLFSTRPLDGVGAGAVIGGIVGGAAGFVVDFLTIGLTLGAGTVGGAAGGAMIGAVIDGVEHAYSICETSELRQTTFKFIQNIPNTTLKPSDLFKQSGVLLQGTILNISDIFEQSDFLRRTYYNNKPLTSYLKSYTITLNDGRKTSIWPYHFTCKKKACLKFGTKKFPDKKEWIQTAAVQIRQTQEFLNNQIKNWFENKNIIKNDPKLHILLSKSALALDTMIRAGYGQNLENQPDLLNIVDNELKSLNFKRSLTKLSKDVIFGIIKNLRYLQDDQDIPTLPIQPIAKNTPVGLGKTEDRHQALNIILNRNYLNPQECRELKTERK